GREEPRTGNEQAEPQTRTGSRTRIPRSAFEENYMGILRDNLRRLGQEYPLAGYSMDLSIWLFREDAPLAEAEDAGPAVRAIPVAWMFQEDLYMMRHLARVQAQITHSGKETAEAAEAAACAVFLAIHGCTKEYIAQYLGNVFRCRAGDEEQMRREILLAKEVGPVLCVRAALTAFLNGRDFEDVLRRAVSLGGPSSGIAAAAGGMAEAFFGMPDEYRENCRKLLPEDLRRAADAFAERMDWKRRFREENPAAQKQWEQALIRASERHPAAVQGNEPLEQAILQFQQKRDQQSFVTALEVLRLRMNQKGRVFVPLASVRRAEAGQAPAPASVQGISGKELPSEGTAAKDLPPNAVNYRMQAIRTRDGRLWQPAYTSRGELNRANAATRTQKGDSTGAASQTAGGGTEARRAENASAGESGSGGMVLSYALDAMLRRFLPAGGDADAQEQIPAQIEGVVLNPYGHPMFLPRKTIEALFVVNRESGHTKILSQDP
ncbi:MAG: ADP-ribosylglycohydrolase family protein, partial [Eubacteriales bacterium]|nr:ADP-ribosylglycohydrolase family protein [Eubacteriales bacterium]